MVVNIELDKTIPTLSRLNSFFWSFQQYHMVSLSRWSLPICQGDGVFFTNDYLEVIFLVNQLIVWSVKGQQIVKNSYQEFPDPNGTSLFCSTSVSHWC